MDLISDLKEIIVVQGRTILELMRKIDIMTEQMQELQNYKDAKEIPF